MIACIYLPYFAALLEQRQTARPTRRPLIIADPTPSAQVLATCRLAAQTGARPGMPVRQARAYCPDAQFIPSNPSLYKTTLNQLRTGLADFSDCIELTHNIQSATGWIDLGHSPQMELKDLGDQVRQRVSQLIGLDPTIGIAGGQFPAQVAATTAKSLYPLIVPAGQEAGFLAPFSIEALPLDKESAQRLHRLGVRTLGQVAALPRTAMITQFGPAGRLWHQLAGGHDSRPLVSQSIEPSEQQTWLFDDPIADRTILINCLHALIEPMTVRLQAQGKVCRCLGLQLQVVNQTSVSQEVSLRQPTAHLGRLLQACSEILDHSQLAAGIIEVMVTLSDLVTVQGEQLELFIHQTPQTNRLFDALTHLAQRYGPACFFQTAVQDQLTRLPERRFRIYEVEAR
ncbi:MAG: hypothetical protein KDJ97_24145 [Anaerolineae bacterium]|nr:hypothetical protein [Anaerolineae bacterium]